MNNLDNVTESVNTSNLLNEPIEFEKIKDEDISPTISNPSPAEETILNWWNETFTYRIAITITEPGISDRNEPVNIFLTFEFETHRINTTRVVKYDGGSSWTEIPSQVWNITSSDNIFISSATITFKASVFKSASSYYYIYFTNMELENKTNEYKQETLLNSNEIWKNDLVLGDYIDSTTINNGIFDISLNKSAGISTFSKNGINYHTNTSMAPGPGISITNGLIGFWDFNEGSGVIAHDKSGNGNDGSLVNNPTWVEGKSQTGLSFTGTQYVSAPITRGDTVTFSLWATWTGTTNKMLFCAGNYPASPINGPDLFFENALGTGRVAWNTWDSWGNPVGILPSSSANGNFHLYVLVVDQVANNAKLYYDGNLLGTGNYRDPSPGVSPNNRTFQIGGYSGYYWTGKIDEVKMYDRALTPQEIQLLFNEKSNCTIDSIQLLQDGAVFKQYQLNWSLTDDLLTQDIITIYAGMEKYSITRTFHWNSIRNTSNNSWQVFNTQYDATKFYEPTTYARYHYDYTNIPQYNITSPFTAQNYTLIRGPITSSGPWTSLGVFLTDFKISGSGITTFSYLEWAGRLIDNQFQFVPGNKSDLLQLTKPLPNSDDALTITFWEVLRVGDSFGASHSSASNDFNTTFYSLKNKLTFVNKITEKLFFNIEFTLYDADGLTASNVNVTLYNTTENWGNRIIPAIDTKKSDINGKIIFTQLKEMNITWVVEYQNPYNAVLQVIELNTGNLTLNTTQSVEIYNINLTSVTITATKLNSIDNIIGANISLYWTPVSGQQQYIGYTDTDLQGSLRFYYLNRSESEGNYSIKLFFYGDFKLINTTSTTLAYELNFTLENSLQLPITVQLDAFSSSFTVTPNSLSNSHYWGQNISLSCLYNYTYNSIPNNISGALVTFEIGDGNTIFKSGVFEGTTPGMYEYQFNTSDPSFGLITNFPYLLQIRAEKAGFEVKTSVITLQIRDINTTLTANSTSIDSFWLENFSIEVYYNDTLNNKPIENADAITFICTSKPNINGTLTSIIGYPGWYNLTLNSTLFDTIGTYSLEVSALEQYHMTKTTTLTIMIDAIPTKVDLLQQYISIFWEENFTIGLNFTDDYYKVPITDGIVTFSIIPLVSGIETTLYHQVEIPGQYRLEFNSTRFPSAGNYTFQIIASKAQYTTKTPTITVQIKTVPTQLGYVSSKNIDVYWKENISIAVDWIDIRNSLNPIGINQNASVKFNVGQLPGLEGVLSLTLITGQYLIVLNSTEFIISGSYTLRIEATKNQYETKSLDFFITINRIRTLINDTVFLSSSSSINVTTNNLFYFSYKTTEGDSIPDASIIFFEWNRQDNPSQIFNGSLLDIGNGIYILNFNTAIREVGVYQIVIQLGLTNYIERTASLTLIIVNKPIEIKHNNGEVLGGSNIIQYQVMEGNTKLITIKLLDPINGNDLTDAEVYLLINNQYLPFTANDNGTYSYEFDPAAFSISAFYQQQVFNAKIIISKTNYTTYDIPLQINILMPEIATGIPTFYFLLTVIGAVVILGTISINKFVQNAKIPGFVKILNKEQKLIDGKKILADKHVALNRANVIYNLFAADWRILDLDLKTVLNLDKEISGDFTTEADVGGN